jgi:hypothetical protein
MAVRRATRLAVSETLAAVGKDLGLPRLRVRWFRGARGYWDDTDAALYALSSKIRPRLLAAAVAAVEPPVIWLRATLKPAVAALLAAHEARHVWQERNLAEQDRRRWHEPTSESDADDYARTGALPATLKAVALQAMAGKPLGRRFGL